MAAEGDTTGGPLEEALVLSYGGLEAYGYHGLEALQSMIERRPGGETGLKSVRCIEGSAEVWAAAEQDGLWSPELAAAAAAADRAGRGGAAEHGGRDGRTGDSSDPTPTMTSAADCAALLGDGGAAILLTFSDGFTAALL